MSNGEIRSESPTVVNGLTPFQAAHWYLGQGLYPIPWYASASGKKIVAVSKFSYADYTDPATTPLPWVMDQWAYEPTWQVALACSQNSGVFAVDVDDADQLAAWERENGSLPGGTWAQTTGRDGGGMHRFFRPSHMLRYWPKQGAFSAQLPQLEIRSNGLVAVSPSVHPSGRRYQWTEDSAPAIADTPWRLSGYLNERAVRRERPAAGSRTAATAGGAPGGSTSSVRTATGDLIVHGIPAGQPQHAALRDLTWHLASLGRSDAEIELVWKAVVSRTPLARPDHPWTEGDFQQHLQSARRKLGGGIPEHLQRWANNLDANTARIEAAEAAAAPAPSPAVHGGSGGGDDRVRRRLDFGELKGYEASQDGMAHLFVDRFGGIIRWCEDEQTAYLWAKSGNGPITHWRREHIKGTIPTIITMARFLGRYVREACAEHVNSLGLDPAKADDRRKMADIMQYVTPFKTSAGLGSIVKLALTNPGIQVSPDAFAANPAMLTFSNGTYSVKTGELAPHRREDMNTHTVKTALDLSLADRPLQTVAPVFFNTLWRMCGAPGELPEELHRERFDAVCRWLGYSLHGSNPEKKMGIFEGATNIGKNQIVEVIQEILGEYLADGFLPKILVKVKGERHDSVMFNLPGKRLVFVNEFTETQILDDHQILTLVNPEGSKVVVRGMRQNETRTPITWTITVTTNTIAKASLSAQVSGRMKIFKMSEVPVPKSERYDIKRAILDNEREAVLAHLVSWWREWFEVNSLDPAAALPTTAEAEEALREYIADNQHPAEEFLAERCQRMPGAYVRYADLWRMCDAYYSDQHSEQPKQYLGGRKKLLQLVQRMEDVQVRMLEGTNVVDGFYGLQLRPPAQGSPEALNQWAINHGRS